MLNITRLFIIIAICKIQKITQSCTLDSFSYYPEIPKFAPQFASTPTPMLYAQMAELVDALVSGTSVGNNVQVRVLFWAQVIQ
jgi:hypothetical protein